jgi:hypothetical protein
MKAKLVTDPTFVSTVKFGKTKYGRLTLVQSVGYFIEGKQNKKRAAFKFKCECGNEIVARAKDVKSGLISSCGCLAKQSKSNNGKKNALPDCAAIKTLLYNRFVKSSEKRKKENELSKEDFLELIQKPCNYCGHDASNTFNSSNICSLH